MSKPKNSNISSENQILVSDEALKQNIILSIYETFYSAPLGMPSGIFSYDMIPAHEKKILEESWEKNASAMEDVAKNGKEFLEIVINEVFNNTSKEKPEEFVKNTMADISELIGHTGISDEFKGITADELTTIVFFSALNLAITEGKNPELKAIDEFLFPDKFSFPDSKVFPDSNAAAPSNSAPQISFVGLTNLATVMAGLSVIPSIAAQSTTQPFTTTSQPSTPPFPGAIEVTYQTGVDSQNKPVYEKYQLNGHSVFAGVYNDRIIIAYFNGTNYTTVVLMENQPIKQSNIFKIASVSATTSGTVNGMTIVFDAQNLIDKDGWDFPGKNIYMVFIPEDMLKNNSTAAIASVNPSMLNIGSGPGNQFFDASKPSNGVKWGSKGPVTSGNLPSCGQATYTSDVSGSSKDETVNFILSQNGVQLVSQIEFDNSGCTLLNQPIYPKVSSSSTGVDISSSSTGGNVLSSSSSSTGGNVLSSSSSSTGGISSSTGGISSSTGGISSSTGGYSSSTGENRLSSTGGYSSSTGGYSSSTGGDSLSSTASTTPYPPAQPSQVSRESPVSDGGIAGIVVGGVVLGVVVAAVAAYRYYRGEKHPAHDQERNELTLQPNNALASAADGANSPPPGSIAIEMSGILGSDPSPSPSPSPRNNSRIGENEQKNPVVRG